MFYVEGNVVSTFIKLQGYMQILKINIIFFFFFQTAKGIFNQVVLMYILYT